MTERRITISQEDLTKIVSDVVGDVLKEHTPTLLHCGMDIAIHNKQHDALDKLLEIIENINKIKWGIARTLAQLAVLGLLSLLGYGILHQFFGR